MRKLVDGGHFYEGARWHGGFWWVSDIPAGQVLRIDTKGERAVAARLEHSPSGLGWLPGGDLLISSMQDRRLLRMGADGAVQEHARLQPYTDFWSNDMVVDSRGRAFVGNLGFDIWNNALPKATGVVRVDPDGTARVVAEDLLFPNGMVVSADGRTLIVAETFGNRMTAFTIGEDGSLRDRRIWAQFGATPSWASIAEMVKGDMGPDGCAIDAEGCVWVADALHNRICRVAQGGRILQELRTPENWGIYSCALGGPDGRSLLICSAPDYDMSCRKERPEAVLFIETVDVPAAMR